MEIHESAEDYLETILILKERTGQVRSIDIATKMNYTKPSISVAMKKLRENISGTAVLCSPPRTITQASGP